MRAKATPPAPSRTVGGQLGRDPDSELPGCEFQDAKKRSAGPVTTRRAGAQTTPRRGCNRRGAEAWSGASLAPSRERNINWRIKKAALPIFYWRYVLKRREWFLKHNTGFKGDSQRS